MSLSQGKKYVVVIISDDPIPQIDFNDSGYGVRHMVREEFQIGESLVVPDTGGWLINKTAPDQFGGGEETIVGKGKIVPVAIADWFKNLFQSRFYLPFYQKRSQ